MLSNPGSIEAQNCFSETQVNFIMLNPQFDSSQFKKLDNFNQVYSNKDIAIYQRILN
jgi:hypothetical protein